MKKGMTQTIIVFVIIIFTGVIIIANFPSMITSVYDMFNKKVEYPERYLGGNGEIGEAWKMYIISESEEKNHFGKSANLFYTVAKREDWHMKHRVKGQFYSGMASAANGDYDDAEKRFIKFQKDSDFKDYFDDKPDTYEKIEEIMNMFDSEIENKWYCCDLGDFGNQWVKGICKTGENSWVKEDQYSCTNKPEEAME